MQEKVEIITNHFEHYWTKIPKNGYCVMSALAGWKGLMRMICFSKNEDRAKLFTQ